MLFVKVDDLKPGMRLGKPIYNKNGVLLYDRDTKLTMQAIYGLSLIHILPKKCSACVNMKIFGKKN